MNLEIRKRELVKEFYPMLEKTTKWSKIWIGFLITIIGAVIGLVLGSSLCWLQIKFGFIRFDEGYVVEAYPVKVMWQDFAAIIGVVMLIGFFAAWYPVRIFTNKSLKFTPL